jgi:hypothetical protein
MFNVLLTVHHSLSVYWNQRDALFIQFIENQGPLHVSSINCSSSRGAAQTACHSQLKLYARNIPNTVCSASPENEQIMFETCRGPWFSINLMKSTSRWFHYTDKLWGTVSKTLNIACHFFCNVPRNNNNCVMKCKFITLFNFKPPQIFLQHCVVLSSLKNA